MGICSSTTSFEGQLLFIIQQSDYLNGLYKGQIVYQPPQHFPSVYLYINLIGKESIKSSQLLNQTQFLFKPMLERQTKLNEGLGATVDFASELQDILQTSSNYSSVQGFHLSTTVYLECYLSKERTSDSQSSNTILNSRKIYVVQIPKIPAFSLPIQCIYDPKQPGFSPYIQFTYAITYIRMKKNVFQIDEAIEAFLIINNKGVNFSIKRNQFTIIQVVDILVKKQKLRTTLPPVVMSSQMLETVHNEEKVIQIQQHIGQAYKDALSFDGQIYSINYYINLIIEWDQSNFQFKIDQKIIIEDI